MPQRLPHVNSDDGTWGDILRQYLMKEHFNDDTDNPVNGGHQRITVRPGTAAAGTAPIKLSSGTLLTTPEPGAIEFTGDSLYFTQTSGSIRKKLMLYNDASGATGDIYYRNSTGAIDRLPIGTSGQVLSVASGVPSWAAAPSGGSQPATRTGVYQFELCGYFSSIPSPSSFTTRRNFLITQKVKRFRVHIINRSHLSDTDASGTLTGLTCYVGPAASDALGELNGRFSATPTQILTSTNLVNGTEVITPWVAPATFTIAPYTPYLLSFGFTVPANAQFATGGGLQWFTYSPADAGSLAATPTRADNQGFLGIYIEYEYENDAAPLIFVVGNSLSAGGNVVSGEAGKNRGELDAWQNQWAVGCGGITASIAVGGSWAVQYGASSPKWNHYNTLASPLDPDMIVFMATASSDMTAGDGSGTYSDDIKAALAAAVNKAKSLYPNARILLSTNPPRLTPAGAVETARETFNKWLASCPMGAVACLDLEPHLTNGAVPARLNAYVNSGDDEHWSARGHQRVSQLIPLRHRLPRP